MCIYIYIYINILCSITIVRQTNTCNLLFEVIQSLSLSRENAHVIHKFKFLDLNIKKLEKVPKMNAKEFLTIKLYLLSFLKFIAVFAYNPEGRKLLAVHLLLYIIN